MVLTFVGRKDEDVYNGDMNQLYGLLARSLQSLVAKVSKSGTYKVTFTLYFFVWFKLWKSVGILNKQ